MKYSLPMPSLGADMDKGKLLEWYIKPGDQIKKGDLIAVVETEKAAVDIESFRTGKVLDLIGNIDEIIPVGQVIATLEIEDEIESEKKYEIEKVIENEIKSKEVIDNTIKITPEAPIQIEEHAAINFTQPTPTSTLITPPRKRLRISPAARRMADELGIDTTHIIGTGHDGAIETRDIETIIEKRKKSIIENPVVSNESLINVRDAIARVMSRSKREIPHYYLQSQFSIDDLMHWLDVQNNNLPSENRLFMPAVLMRAIVLALKTNPAMNGTYENGVFIPKSEIHLGITVALKPDGVMTPAIIDAHNLSLSELNFAFRDLVRRARAGKLRNREMTDGTITVTNVGDLGADEVTGIIFAPQVSLIGLGRIHKAAIVDGEGGLRVGFVLNVTVAADHRVTDGLTGSKLLNALAQLIAQPDRLIE